jgi:hypothetical protein
MSSTKLTTFMRQVAREADRFEAEWWQAHATPGMVDGGTPYFKAFPLTMSEDEWWEHFQLFLANGSVL